MSALLVSTVHVAEARQTTPDIGQGLRGDYSQGGWVATFRGAIFDVDGVLVDSPHQKAWRESLRELMESDWREIRDDTTWSPDAFTSVVYQ